MTINELLGKPDSLGHIHALDINASLNMTVSADDVGAVNPVLPCVLCRVLSHTGLITRGPRLGLPCTADNLSRSKGSVTSLFYFRAGTFRFWLSRRLLSNRRKIRLCELMVMMLSQPDAESVLSGLHTAASITLEKARAVLERHHAGSRLCA